MLKIIQEVPEIEIIINIHKLLSRKMKNQNIQILNNQLRKLSKGKNKIMSMLSNSNLKLIDKNCLNMLLLVKKM